jgi:phosphatidylglycerol---prolipoprotein diacylglyceryl transferase
VNNKIESLPFQPTQAEVIATCLMIAGVVVWIVLRQKNSASKTGG